MTPIPDSIATLCVKYDPVGSRVTCNPPPTNTDEDWLLLTWRIMRVRAALQKSRFELGGSQIADTKQPACRTGQFESWKLGHLNLIITNDLAFYERFMAATRAAQQFNLLRKVDRITLFQAVLYGK